MTFVDTSALYALADRADPNHERACNALEALLAADETLLTHSYVLVEAMALLQRRLGLDAALHLAADADSFETEWITERRHDEAVQRLRRRNDRRISLVDEVSFGVMGDRGVRRAFAFDDDFARRGFELVPTT